MEAYLDNSATTRAYPEVGDLVYKVMCQDYGNPSSMHRKGVDAEHYVKEAKETIAKVLKVNAKDIYFTSGGTESDNLALIGCARANRRAGNHLITTSIEHPAILNTMRYLEEEEGFRVTYLPVDASGRVNLDALKEALCPETILVSVMYVNNEVGTLQPIDEAVKIVKEYNSSILFHSDAVQGFGKYHIYPKRQKIDLLSASGHKIHGPKGTGFLYVGEKVKIKPILFGGGQQKDLRSGTENVPGFAGFGLATKIVYEDLEARIVRMRAVKDRLTERLKALPDVYINEGEAPHILSVSFVGVRSEVMLHALEERQIYVSSGSACSSNKPAVSHVLSSIGLQKNRLESTIRFSFSAENTVEQADYAADVIEEILPVYRKYVRKK